MKKTLLMLFAAAAFVGCDQGQDVNEPAGTERDPAMQQRDTGDTNTNTLSDPSGASSGQSGSGASQQGGTSSGGASGAGNP